MHRTASPTGSRARLALAGVLAATAFACGGGGGGGSSPAQTATLDVLIHDAPADDLLAFEGTLEELRLTGPAGLTTGNLLAEPVPVELLSLQEISRWIAQAEVGAGTYDAAFLRFAPGSIEAKAMTGAGVAVQVLAHETTIPFDAPVTVGAGDYRRIELDVDLDDSLLGDVAAQPVLFDPTGRGADSTAQFDPIESFRGIVVGASLPDRRLQVRAFTDDSLDMQLGIVTVGLDDDTALVDVNEAMFDSIPSFFASLTLTKTVVEVHGEFLPGGNVRADKIEIEDQAGGDGMEPRVVVKGIVADLTDSGFELLLIQVVQGQDLADAVLDELGDPQTISVVYDGDTTFFAEHWMVAGPEDLAVGQHVEVEFRVFDQPPFLAAEIEIRELAVEVHGVIDDITGLPDSFVMIVNDFDPILTSSQGDDDDDNGDDDDDDDGDGSYPGNKLKVEIDLAAGDICLKTFDKPELAPEELVRGLKVDVWGTLDGLPGEEVIHASKVRVRPGRVDKAEVTGTVPSEQAFQVLAGSFKQPFGGEAAPGPLDVLIDPRTRFWKDASSEQELYDLFDTLADDELLEVRVEGLGTAIPGQVVGFEIRAQVKKQGQGPKGGD